MIIIHLYLTLMSLDATDYRWCNSNTSIIGDLSTCKDVLKIFHQTYSSFSVFHLNQVVQPSPIESQRVVVIQQPQPVLVPSPPPSALRTVFSQVRMIVSIVSLSFKLICQISKMNRYFQLHQKSSILMHHL